MNVDQMFCDCLGDLKFDCVDQLPYPLEAKDNTIYILPNGRSYLRLSNGDFAELGPISTYGDKYPQDESVYTKAEIDAMFETVEIKNSPSNCPNCGAPLVKGKCEYCGTEVI